MAAATAAETYKNQIPIATRIAATGRVMPSTTGLAHLNPGAATQIVAYLDPQDSFSARTFLSLYGLATSNNRVGLVIRFKPSSANPLSLLKAQYIYGALSQNAFWQLSNIVFNGTLSITSLAKLETSAQTIGLNFSTLQQSAQSPATNTLLSADQTTLQQLGSAVAPTIFINGVLIYDFEVKDQPTALATIRTVTGN